MDVPSRLAGQILWKLIDEVVQVVDVLIVSVVQLAAKLQVQVEWDLVLVLNAVKQVHIALEFGVSRVDTGDD